jgi:imidazole glycerol phosphate synthase glutamine amidotransferase subunit
MPRTATFLRASEEAPDAGGLALLPGRVRKFATELHVPHVGWAQVDLTEQGKQHPVLAEAFRGSPQFFYHVHSYYPTDLAQSHVLGTGEYGVVFPTLVGRESVIGAQFHPEKSQQAGIALLSAFAEWRP